MKKSKNTFYLVATVIIVILLIFLSKMYLGDTISDFVTIATAVFGAVAIWYQLRKDYQITKSEFIYNLNDTISNNENITYIYGRLKEYRDLEDVVITPEEGRRMGDYVMFFEIMGYLLEEGMITLEMMDRIFANKFFLFTNNPYAQEYQMKYSQINRPMLELYCEWYNYRVKKNLPELYPKKSLRMYEEYFLMDARGRFSLNDEKADVGYGE